MDIALVLEPGFVMDDKEVWSTVERSSSTFAAAAREDTMLIRPPLLRNGFETSIDSCWSRTLAPPSSDFAYLGPLPGKAGLPPERTLSISY